MKVAPKNGFEHWYTIRSNEIDYRKRLTVPALMQLMQEASMENALQLEISLWDKGMEGLSWVILRKELTVYSYPKLGDKIKVLTYPAGFQKIFAYRDFWVIGEDGEVIAHAASTWTLMNLETRRVQRIPPEILSLETPSKDEKLPVPALKLQLPDQYNDAYGYQIKHYDLDWNEHVNNIVFTRLMIQGVPEEVLRKRNLISYTIHIKSECHLDEVVKIEVAQSENDIMDHQLLGGDGRVIAIAQSSWRDE